MAKMNITDLHDLYGKRVLVRVDFNIAMKPKEPTTRNEAVITDDNRIQAALNTINYLTSQGAKVILMSHLGRPKGKVVEGFRLDVVAKRLSELVSSKVTKVDDCIGPKVVAAIAAMLPGEILLLENVRFYAEEESKDDAIRLPFAQKLAALGDVYVNDAFGTSHRDHASTASIARFLKPAVAGMLMQSEIETLGKALSNPDRPFVAMLGGAKIADKLQVIDNLIGKVDTLLIGGGMAYTFFKAQGYEIGKSLLDPSMLDAVNEMVSKAAASKTKLVLPEDVLVAAEAVAGTATKIVPIDKIPPEWEGLDIGPKTIATFEQYIQNARLVIWNGPVGLFEIPDFAIGTNAMAAAMAKTAAFTIIGGGDSAAAVKQMGFADQISFISTGGGASLEFLEGKALPGVEMLDEK